MTSDIKDSTKVRSTNYSKNSAQTTKTEKFASRFNKSLDDTRHLAALKTIILASSDDNHDRIISLKNEVNSGHYQVKSHNLAIRMMDAFETLK